MIVHDRTRLTGRLPLFLSISSYFQITSPIKPVHYPVPSFSNDFFQQSVHYPVPSFSNEFFPSISSLPSPLILKPSLPSISSLPDSLNSESPLPSISSLPDSLNSESPPFDSRSSCLNQSSQYGDPLDELNCLTSPYSMTKVHLWVLMCGKVEKCVKGILIVSV